MQGEVGWDGSTQDGGKISILLQMPKTLGAVANDKIKVNVHERSIQNVGEK